MSETAGERSFAPTAKRRQEAARRGDVLKSRELATALVVLAGVGWALLMGPALVAACRDVMAASFRFGRADVEDFEPWRPLLAAGWRLAAPLGSLLALGVAAAVASAAALGSLAFNPALLAPRWSRVDPLAGLGRIFGSAGWIELAKSLAKVGLLGAVGFVMLRRSTRLALGLVSSDLGTALGTLGATLSAVLLAMALGLVAIAGLDVPLQAWRRYAKLRMTRQEVKDEGRQSEGSPETKGRIRQAQRAVLKRSTRKAVAEAQVILTNPTHFAVALRYDRERGDQVPVVVARGRGATALAIRDLAREAAVPCLEYPLLARAVYYTSQEGQEVRDDLYHAIAAVLAFVFTLNWRAGGTAVPPSVAVPAGARFDEHGAALA